MSIKTIRKDIDIMAPKETIWNILFNNELNKKWYKAFSDGSQARTDWQEGSQAIFTDETGSGMLGMIKENKPFTRLTIEYYGYLNNGKEDILSEGAKAIKGTQETYELVRRDGVTRLYISCEMEEQYYDVLNDSWDTALQKIKSMAEK